MEIKSNQESIRNKPGKGLIFVIIVSHYLLFQILYNLTAYNEIIPGGFDISTVYSIIRNFIPTVIAFYFNYIIVFKFFTKLKIGTKLCLDFLFSLLFLLVFNALYLIISHGKLYFTVINWGGTIFNDLYILLFAEVYHYLVMFKASLLREEQARINELNYKYNALTAQINPHFLFNSLNELYLLIPSNPQLSQEMVLSLSNMYRYILSKQKHQTIMLHEELEFLDSFEKWISLKCNDCFRIEYTGREICQDARIIPFSLQLLVDNIVKHNIISQKHPMVVNVDISPTHICICNAITKKRSETGFSVGLTYMTEMYARYGKKVIVDNNGSTFTVTIPFITSNTPSHEVHDNRR